VKFWFEVIILIFISTVSHAESECPALQNPIVDKATSNILETSFKHLRKKDAYSGCLFFQEDIRIGDDFTFMNDLKPNALTRSWYRFGEPAPDKAYEHRADLIQDLKKKDISVGGGTSLSIINEHDFANADFDPAWQSVDIAGKPIVKNPGTGAERKYASLSAPGFRSYLVKRLVEQAKLGVNELALGETNGMIQFDDYSLGVKGDEGFVQWVKRKYPGKSLEWWNNYLGPVGSAIQKNKPVTREMFKAIENNPNFKAEWGEPESWHGTSKDSKPAFLAYAYKKNLSKVMQELKSELKKNKLDHVAVDIWGTADWTNGVSPKPDAVLNSPPDERWGLNWNIDPNFDLIKNRERIKNEMQKQIKSAAPAKMVYMFDHPHPFFDSFVKLSDHRQAVLTKFFADLSRELGAKFILRSYTDVPGGPGTETKTAIAEICEKQKLQR